MFATNHEIADELSSTERDILYYMAGHTVRQVLQFYSTCTTCKTLLKQNVVSEEVGLLQFLKDYTGKSLVKCSEKVFKEMSLPAENLFRLYERKNWLTSATSGIKKTVVTDMVRMDKDIDLPKCHDIENSLFSQYFKLRLRNFSNAQRDKHREELKAKRKGAERGSKSLQMRKSVENLK